MQKQWFAIRTIAKMTAKAYFRNRTALYFTIAFPLIFLVVFGALFGKSTSVSFKVALINKSNTAFSKTIAKDLSSSKIFKVDTSVTNLSAAENKISNGQDDAAIVLPAGFGDIGQKGYPTGSTDIYYNPADQQTAAALSSVLSGIFGSINNQLLKSTPPLTVVSKSTNKTTTTPFDYVFAGMLGFAIIGIGIFGPTNAFPEMKKQGVLRRMRTTPITAAQYIIGNILAYITVGLVSVAVLFIVSRLFFHLNMSGNLISFIIVAILGIIAIFGFGMAVGGWAKNEQQAAPLSNIVAFPMMFLSGTFFPTYLMPDWLQNVAKFLPLTPIINALRYIVTGEKTFFQLGSELLLIGGWIIIIYVVAFRVFRWE